MKRKDDKALDVLAQAIDSAVKEHVKNASFDRTTEGIITNIFSNSKYEVLAFGSKYTVAVPQSVSFVLNEKVRVVVPQNNWSAMFIEKEDVVSSGGGSGGGHVIENYDGTVLPQRNILKFDGMEVTDDSAGRTVVHGLGVKVVDSVAPPNIPVYAILKPVGTSPPIPLYVYPDGETIVTDSNTGKMSVKSAPKLTTPVKIGNANFDGSMDINLADVGLPYYYQNIKEYTASSGITSVTTTGVHLFSFGPIRVFSLALKTNASGSVTFDLGFNTDYTINAPVQIDSSPNCTFATFYTNGKFTINISAANAYHRCFCVAIAINKSGA